jgi:hypothetical protein
MGAGFQKSIRNFNFRWVVRSQDDRLLFSLRFLLPLSLSVLASRQELMNIIMTNSGRLSAVVKEGQGRQTMRNPVHIQHRLTPTAFFAAMMQQTHHPRICWNRCLHAQYCGNIQENNWINGWVRFPILLFSQQYTSSHNTNHATNAIRHELWTLAIIIHRFWEALSICVAVPEWMTDRS